MNGRIDVETNPPDLDRRLRDLHKKIQDEAYEMTSDVIDLIHGSVDPYPPELPGQTYQRTGDLGAGLGVDMDGSIIGRPSIREVTKLGDDRVVGVIGSDVPEYNIYVIGDNTQAWMHRGRWWTMQALLDKVFDKVLDRVRGMGERIGQWMDGRGY